MHKVRVVFVDGTEESWNGGWRTSYRDNGVILENNNPGVIDVVTIPYNNVKYIRETND